MKPRTILCAAGGTAGSIIPLRLLIDARRRLIPSAANDRIVWVRTTSAIDRQYLPEGLFALHSLPIAKWRRYLAIGNALTPFVLLLCIIKSIGYCLRYRSDVVWTSGSFVGVPVAWAAWIMRIPVLSIQQDVVRGLANRLIEPFARQRILTIPPRLLDRPSQRPYRCIGSLVESPRRANTHSQSRLPMVLVLGGSSGAQGLNILVWKALSTLPAGMEIVHSIGKVNAVPPWVIHPGYRAYTSIGRAELHGFLARATLVVSRAGMNAVSECALYGKPMVIVPLPATHQINNARAIEREHAAIVVEQSTPGGEFTRCITDLLKNPSDACAMGQRLHRLLPAASQEDILDLVRV